MHEIFKQLIFYNFLIKNKFNGDWGLGIGGLGFGVGAQSPTPNPQTPIPHPQPPLNFFLFKK